MPDRIEPHAREVRDHVRLHIARGIVHLVEQLLLAGLQVDHAAGAGELGDDGAPVLADLGEGKAEVREVRRLLVAGIDEISAGDLPRAFEEMPDERALAEPVPVVGAPGELVHQRREKQRRIAHPAGDHDIGAAGERLDDRLGAEIGVGGNHARGDVGDAALGFDERQVAPAQRICDIVAGDGGDLQARQAHLPRDRHRGADGADRVRGAHVGDDLHAVGDAGPQHRAEPLGEQRIEAGVGIAPACLLRERDGALGEAFEHEVVEVSAGGEVGRGLDAVARISGTGADPNGPHGQAS